MINNSNKDINFVTIILGHYSEGGTPVIIPNTSVKSFSAFGIAGLPWWERRSWPSIIVALIFSFFFNMGAYFGRIFTR